jgi:hypothetical protein
MSTNCSSSQARRHVDQFLVASGEKVLLTSDLWPARTFLALKSVDRCFTRDIGDNDPFLELLVACARSHSVSQRSLPLVARPEETQHPAPQLAQHVGQLSGSIPEIDAVFVIALHMNCVP